jgi:hypothetical protein
VVFKSWEIRFFFFDFDCPDLSFLFRALSEPVFFVFSVMSIAQTRLFCFGLLCLSVLGEFLISLGEFFNFVSNADLYALLRICCSPRGI